jgi:hypothetical protein
MNKSLYRVEVQDAKANTVQQVEHPLMLYTAGCLYLAFAVAIRQGIKSRDVRYILPSKQIGLILLA